MRYVYGIIATGTPVTFDAAGVDDHGGDISTVCHDGLGAVVSPTDRADYRGMTRQEALRYLVAHQGVVEAVMGRFTALPVKFGTVLPDEARVRRLLEQGYTLLRSTLEEIAGRVQMEVVVTWDLAAVFQEISAEEEIARAKSRVVGRPSEEAAEARVAIGQMVKASLDRRRSALQDYLVPWLRDVALDLVANPLLDDGMVANVALLLDGAGREALDRRLVELDRQFQGWLNFRCVGPLPPYSFATVEVQTPAFEAVDTARYRLGLGKTATLEEIKRAYRQLAARVHPDVNPEGDKAGMRMAELTEAYRLLAAYGESQTSEVEGITNTVCAFDREMVARTMLISIVRPEGLGAQIGTGG